MDAAYERITALINPAYLECLPSFVRERAKECCCKRAAREFPELYQSFSGEAEPGEEEKDRMKAAVNRIFAERLDKHRLETVE